MISRFVLLLVILLTFLIALAARAERLLVLDKNGDNTETIQKALTFKSNPDPNKDEPIEEVKLPDGDYAVEDTVYLGYRNRLSGSHGTRLFRKGPKRTPIVQHTNNYCETANLWLVFPAGMKAMEVGPRPDQVADRKPANICFGRISNVKFQGAGDKDSIGINFVSSQPTAGGSNYFTTVENCHFRELGTPVRLTKECNGHSFLANVMYQVKGPAYHATECTENTYALGFAGHLSPEMPSVFKFEKCGWQWVLGVQAEPGGKARLFDIDAESMHNVILAHDNCSSGPRDLGFKTTSLSHGDLRLHSLLPAVPSASDAIYVASYGATPNDAIDDAEGLQKALDAAKGGRRVRMASGVYLASKQLIVRSGTVLEGLPGTERPTIRAAKTIVPPDALLAIEADARYVSIEGIRIEPRITHTGLKLLGKATNLNISNCELVGSLPHTNYLIDFNGEVSQLTIKGNYFANALYPVRLRDKIEFATISENLVTSWVHYAFHLRGGEVYGPTDVTIENNKSWGPAKGKGGARQHIVCLGHESKPTTNLVRIRISGNTCVGAGQPWAPTDPESLGSGDLVVMHHSRDSSITNNFVFEGGEIGVTVTRDCHNILENDNIIARNDAHGSQYSGQNDKSTDILGAGNLYVDNGKGEDGNRRVMASQYVQEGERISLHANANISTKDDARALDSGVKIAISSDVDDSGNSVHFKNLKGAKKRVVQDSPLLDRWPR